ncbi:MAG TPA: glycosyltransferase [Candidatus Cloacimonadota bacterium]|nr:glycosyltransferase [Candidatus Cloacimonadota bacterium]
MVVIHIISSMGRGGKERQLSIICKYSKEVKNYIVYYNEASSNYIAEYQLDNIIFRVTSRSLLSRITETRRLCSKLKADCIVTWGIQETVIGMIVSKLNGIPMLNFSIRHGIRQKKFSHLFRSFLLHLNKYVVANSRAGLKANNLSKGMILYNGIENIPDFIFQKDKKVLQKEKLGFSDKPVLVSVANLVPYKDYATVLKVLYQLKKEGKSFFYIIIGEGPCRSEIENMIRQFGMENDVLLTGSITNVEEYLRLSDVMIHSSLGEGCSNAVLEGMKVGLPIIATKVGGTPEIVDAENAMLFEYGNTDSLYECLNKLMTNPELLDKMGLASNQIVKEKFSTDKMINNYEIIIKAVTAKDKSMLKKLRIKTDSNTNDF